MALTVDAHMNGNSKEVMEGLNKEDSLRKVGEETGGRVLLNTNDFDRAIVESVRDSSTFYQVGYYPAHKQWDGKFHTIKVKVAGDGLVVRHRRGYYATDPEKWRKSGEGEMKAALERDSIVSTGVLFYARAMPPSGSADVKVEFLVDPHTIPFSAQSENQHECNLEFQVQAFTPEGKLGKAEVRQAQTPLTPDTSARIQNTALPLPLPL